MNNPNESLEDRVSELESKLAETDRKRQALEEIVGDMLVYMTGSASESLDALRANMSTILEDYRDTLRS